MQNVRDILLSSGSLESSSSIKQQVTIHSMETFFFSLSLWFQTVSATMDCFDKCNIAVD